MLHNKQPSELENVLSIDPGKEFILPAIALSDGGHLSQACRGLYNFFKHDLSRIRLIKLAYYLAQEPNPHKVNIIIGGDVTLLQIVFKEIKLPSRIVKNVTSLQFAYGARHREMRETLEPLFTKLCGNFEAGRKEIDKQLQEKFDNISNGTSFNFSPIIQAISNELFNHGRDATTNRLI